MNNLKLKLRRLLKPKVIKEHGVKIDVSNAAISPGLRDVFYRGSYEKQEMSILKKTLNREDLFLDIGAGVGLTSIWAAKHLGSSKDVVAVEASPDLVSVIKYNAALNGIDINAVWAAAAVDEGEADFFVTPHFWSSSLLPREDANVVRVPTMSLNDLLLDHKPTYLMMDVEGAEHPLILSSDLKGVEKICIEIHPHYIGLEKATEVADHILKLGFKADRSLCVGHGYFFYRSH